MVVDGKFLTKEEVAKLEIPAYPQPTDAGHCEKLTERYLAMIEPLERAIIEAHGRGDHEIGDALRPKVRILRSHVERIATQKGIFERG